MALGGWAALFLAGLAITCVPETPGGSQGADGPPRVVEDPGFLEALPRYSLEPESSVGGFLPDLGTLRWFGVSSAGSVAVSQIQHFLIRLLDPDGRDLEPVGGARQEVALEAGGMPSQGGAGWIGDTLWVHDVTLGRIVLYGEGPRTLRTLPPLAAARPKAGDETLFPAFLSVWPVALYPGDTLLVTAEGAVGEPPAGSRGGDRHLLRISVDGRIQDHVLRIPGEPAPNGPQGHRRPASVPTSGPATALLHVAPAGDRIALVTQDSADGNDASWRLVLVDAHGTIVHDRRFLFRGAPPPERVLIGADHRTWVRLTEAAGQGLWLVLDPRGNPEGTARLPVNARLLAAYHDHVWVSELDPLGAPALARHRILKKELRSQREP